MGRSRHRRYHNHIAALPSAANVLTPTPQLRYCCPIAQWQRLPPPPNRTRTSHVCCPSTQSPPECCMYIYMYSARKRAKGTCIQCHVYCKTVPIECQSTFQSVCLILKIACLKLAEGSLRHKPTLFERDPSGHGAAPSGQTT